MPLVNPGSFQVQLEPILNAFSGTLGFKAVRLSDGFTLEHLPDEVFPAASVVKVPLMLEALKQAEEGKLDLHARIPMPADERVGGSGVLYRLEGGAGLTLLDYVTLMIVVSDNTATNIVLDAIGGRDAVNSRLQSWGFAKTTVVGKLMLPPERKNEDQKAGKLAEITPHESALLLERLVRGDLLGEAMQGLALETLEAQQYTEILARYLPDGVKTATKSGQITGVRNDIGIVTTERPYVLALCSKGCADQRFHIDNEAVLTLAQVSRLVYDAMLERDYSKPSLTRTSSGTR
jgi:beta-lactamase class A